MSDIDAKIEAVLDRFDADIERVTQRLDPILQSSSVDELSEAEPEKKAAAPYALSAYALSSMLFAYLRSEGKDTAVVMPELARVKERLERLSAPPRPTSESEASRGAPANANTEGKLTSESAGKPAGKSAGKSGGKSGGKSAGKPTGKPTGKSADKPAGKHMRFEDASSAPKRSKKAKARG